MRCSRWFFLAFGTAVFGAHPAWGQVLPAEAKGTTTEASPASLTGQSAVDLIRLDGKALSIPLRNAGVVNGSDTLELDGKKLERGKDYGIDCGTGMVMLMVPVKAGTFLRASYRYDKTIAKSSSTAASPLSNLKLQFAPGATGSFSLGMVERTADGTVLQSNLYSLKTNFSGGGKLGFGMTGVVALSQRSKVQSQSLLGGQQAGNQDTLGEGSAIVQSLNSKVGSGSIKLNYQSVDKSFTNMSAFTDAGMDGGTVDSLSKERGLKRLSYQVNDFQMGASKFSQGMDEVSDGKASVVRRNFGFTGKSLSAGFTSRKVDSNFNRFNDLREEDRKLLGLEKGLTTNEWFADLAQRNFAMKLQSKSVTDGAGTGFQKLEFGINTQNLKFNYGSSTIDSGFNRMNGVREQNWQQLNREQGFRRQNYSLNLGPAVRQLKGLDIASRNIRTDSGSLNAFDISAQGANWSLEHYELSFDQGFTSLGQLSDAEANQNISTISKMYEPSGIGAKGPDRNWFNQNSGLQRQATRLRFSPGSGLGVQFDHLNIAGSKDQASVDTIRIQNRTTDAGLRLQNIGRDFTDSEKLLSFERERLGMLTGLQKNDFWFNTKIGSNLKINVSQMNAKQGEDEASRTQIMVDKPGLTFSLNQRSVDDGFNNVGQLIDPEREALQSMVGVEQRQMQLNWLMSRDLSLKLDWTDSQSKDGAMDGLLHHTLLNWSPDKFTKLEFYRMEQKWGGDTTTLADNSIERIVINRAVPRFGSIQLEQEERNYDGENAPSDSLRNTIILEGKVNQTTTLRAENTQTNFDNGDREQIQAHTLQTEVTKQAGVAVTDTAIKRTGTNTRPNERKRQYGLWVNLGKGIRLDYGYKRDLNGDQPSTLNSNFGLTNGNLGNLDFGGANYQTQRWDGARQRSLGNFSLGLVKPMQLGMLRNFTFRVATDTIRDYDLWQREQQQASFASQVAGASIGFDYLSQFAPQVKQRAIDRTFKFETVSTPTSKFKVSYFLKDRNLPNNQHYDIRNLSFEAKFIPGFVLTHSMQTYPEVPRGDALLGSVVQPTRTMSWKLNQVSPDKNTLFGLGWSETLNDQTRQMSRLANVDVTFFAKNPSPLKLTYGLEQADLNGGRRTIHRYSLEYNQRPGPNQLFNLSVGNVSWQHGNDANTSRENWTLRMEWQMKF